MNTNVILGAIFIALSFTTWGIIANYLKIPGHWASVIIVVSSVVSSFAFSISKIVSEPLNNYKGLVILFTLGIVNGYAVFKYGTYCVNPKIPAGMFITMIVTLQIILAPFIDYVVNRNVPSFKQVIGVILAATAAIIMRK